MKTLKIAFRNLLKNKVVSTINWVGLTLGVVISLLLLAYVQQEKDTDKFIAHADDIQMLTINGDPYISKPMVALLKNNFSDMPITYFAESWSGQVFLSDEKHNKFKVQHLLDADSSFFQVFQFEVLYGDLQATLNSPNKIVLTEKLAKKIFGNANPVGQTINYHSSYLDGELLEVTAVLKDLPENTSWKFDAVLSIETNHKIDWYKRSANNWGAQNYSACCRVMPNTNLRHLETQLQRLAKTYKKEEGEKVVEAFGVYPFTNNYFRVSRPMFKHSDANTLLILQLIALLILLMATINYINLVSAQRQKRNKSVAVMKMLGSQRWGVVQLFMVEAGIMLLAVLVGVALLAPLAIDVLNALMGTHYTVDILLSFATRKLLFVIFAFVFLATGFIPGVVFSRHQALALIKPNIIQQKASLLRNALPIIQFAVAIALMISLFVIKKQNDMMLNQDTGFNKAHIVLAPTNKDIKKDKQAFTNELKRISGVTAVTFADAVFGHIGQNWATQYTYKGESNDIQFTKIGVNANFFEFFGIALQEGTWFENREQDYGKLIMNETAIQQYGIPDFEEVSIDGLNGAHIVGVVEDFNFSSAHMPIIPIAFRYEGDINDICFLKLNTHSMADTKNTLSQIEQLWSKLSPNLPLEYKFMDQTWDALYKKEVQFQKVLNYAGVISLFIACLGLFGLSMFVAERRTKEIGIRKVNGATIGEILKLLNVGFVKWILVAFVIATPIAYYAMNKWLENFAYKTELSWWLFALAGLLALFIALLTVSWQSYRAASRNPVEALRYE